MITDWLFGMFYALLQALLNMLPAASTVEIGDSLRKVYGLIGGLNYWLPIHEMMRGMAWVAGGWAALIVFRVVRLLNPLGG